jgi:hypothetical protein
MIVAEPNTHQKYMIRIGSMSAKYTFRSIAILSLVLSGCATTPPLSDEALPSYALLIPDMRSEHGHVTSIISELDGVPTWREGGFQVSGKRWNAHPGMKTVEITFCPQGTGPSCREYLYKFEALPGFAYFFSHPEEVRVFDRFDLEGEPVDVLKRFGGREFVTTRSAQ